jgi:hypothetical protein
MSMASSRAPSRPMTAESAHVQRFSRRTSHGSQQRPKGPDVNPLDLSVFAVEEEDRDKVMSSHNNLADIAKVKQFLGNEYTYGGPPPTPPYLESGARASSANHLHALISPAFEYKLKTRW